MLVLCRTVTIAQTGSCYKAASASKMFLWMTWGAVGTSLFCMSFLKQRKCFYITSKSLFLTMYELRTVSTIWLNPGPPGYNLTTGCQSLFTQQHFGSVLVFTCSNKKSPRFSYFLAAEMHARLNVVKIYIIALKIHERENQLCRGRIMSSISLFLYI